MPLPLPPRSSPGSSSSSPSRPAWFSLSRWFGGTAAAAAAHSRTPAGAEADIEQLRTQARRRLIGAVVLLAVGVVAFPLVFETEPRPMGVDTPMQRVQGAGGAVGGIAAPEAPPPAQREVPAGPSPEPPPQAAAALAEPPAPAEAPPALAAAEPKPTPAAPLAAAPAPATSPTAAAATAEREQGQRAEAQRARALLEGRSAAVPAVPAATPAAPVVAARYVVQVGAFTEKRALADARSRVERLGLKTYTQVIESPAGPRTRVRVGPFDSRAEADAAAVKLRAAGLPAAILTL